MSSFKTFSTNRPLLTSIGLGLFLCLSQIGFTWIFAPQDLRPLSQYYRMEIAPGWDTQSSPNPFLNRYQRFNNWDSLRFFEIAQNGYHIPMEIPAEGKLISYPDIHQYRANVTNLPTYPLLVRGVQALFQLAPQYSLLVAAGLACGIFWIYFFLYLFEKSFTKKEALLAAVTFGFAPGAFYLVCGYSESSLLAAEMGLFYWTDRLIGQLREPRSANKSTSKNASKYASKTISWLAVGAHGFLATFSRLPAIPLALYPILKSLSYSKSPKESKHREAHLSLYTNGALLSLVSACGLFAFLIYCQLKFGRWDTYFYLSQLIGQVPDYWAVFKPSSYIPRFFFEDTQLSMNRALVPWLVAVAGVSLSLDLHKINRLSLYSIAAGLFYITLAGKAGGGMDGMIRYSLPIYLPLVLCLAKVLHERKAAQSLPRLATVWPSWATSLIYLFSLSCQAWCAYRYLHGSWVS